MIRERFSESRDLNRMETRELVAGRFQLNCRCVGGKVADVGPVENFDRFLGTGKSGGGESSPESLETDVGAGDTPVAGGFDDLNVVDANHTFAIDVDELFIEDVARQQDFAFATDE